MKHLVLPVVVLLVLASGCASRPARCLDSERNSVAMMNTIHAQTSVTNALRDRNADLEARVAELESRNAELVVRIDEEEGSFRQQVADAMSELASRTSDGVEVRREMVALQREQAKFQKETIEGVRAAWSKWIASGGIGGAGVTGLIWFMVARYRGRKKGDDS